MNTANYFELYRDHEDTKNTKKTKTSLLREFFVAFVPSWLHLV